MSLLHYRITNALNRAQERRENDQGVRKRFQGPGTVNTPHTIIEAESFELSLLISSLVFKVGCHLAAACQPFGVLSIEIASFNFSDESQPFLICQTHPCLSRSLSVVPRRPRLACYTTFPHLPV